MKTFGLIGHPVEHSMSQAMHNAVFTKLGLECRYDLFDVMPENLIEFFETDVSGFTGLNVTVPHKVAVIEFLDELSREAELIGAVNTIQVGEKLVGHNTDGIGAIKTLQENEVEGTHNLCIHNPIHAQHNSRRNSFGHLSVP